MIDSLMYLVTGPRPDLAYTISFLAQLSSCPTDEHIKAAKHIFRYVNRTRNLGLFYPYTTTNAIDVYVDSDFAGCHDTRRSTSGYIVLFNNCCVSWLSKKQASVTKSTTEAEFVAMFYGTCHIRWLLKGLADLRLHVPIAMPTDNTGANFLAVTLRSTFEQSISPWTSSSRAKLWKTTCSFSLRLNQLTILLIYAPKSWQIPRISHWLHCWAVDNVGMCWNFFVYFLCIFNTLACILLLSLCFGSACPLLTLLQLRYILWCFIVYFRILSRDLTCAFQSGV